MHVRQAVSHNWQCLTTRPEPALILTDAVQPMLSDNTQLRYDLIFTDKVRLAQSRSG